MGRLPKAGRVKTRLTSRWSPEVAAQLYAAFLRDVFALVDRAHERLEFRRLFSCAVESSEELEKAREMMPRGWEILAQEGDDLGERIEFSRAACEADQVLVLGSDAPAMDPQRILQAFELLGSADTDLVIGPTNDGGYDLIGFRGRRAGVLRDISWSTDAVAQQTRERARDSGYTLEELELGYDVDHPKDLDRVLRASANDDRIAVNTTRALRALSDSNI